jgi:penicillin-binding protein 1A
MLGVLGSASFTVGLLTAIAAKIPELDPAKQKQQANTYVYAANGYTVLSILRGSQARILIPSERISPWMKHAIVAAEDKRFYEHRGVDMRGMARAVWADVTHHGAVQGGSTITQQFVKNAFLTSQKSIGRKLVEAALAWQLEQKWTKDKILTSYLNTVYFGNGAYGVEQAARIYFHHRALTLNPAESALLAAIPEDPSSWDPVAHPQTSHERRDLVLHLMLDQGYLTESQYVKWVNYPMPDPKDVSLPSTQGVAAPYFANYVKDQLVNRFGPAKTFGGGLKVKTTLRVDLQGMARDAIASVLPPNGNGPTAAMVVLDAQKGDVLAMVGGENYHKNQFNLATQGERQPGSSFKPFVLATALRDNMAPTSTLVSEPVTINADGRLWKVENYEGEYLGRISLTQAIAYSDNSVFSQLTALVGPRNVRDTARALGITSKLNGYFAIGLGAEPATPLEMARAYQSFADGGSRVDGSIFGNQPRVVDTIQVGKKTEENGIVAHRVLTSTQAATLNELLQGVIKFGTGRAAQLPGRQVAGKTGTTENYGDAWFVGYTPQYVAAVWVGYPDKLIPMTTEFHGKPVAGGTFPALIWKAFMQKALAKKEPMDFTPPDYGYAAPVTVVNRGGVLERDDGICKNTVQMEFFGGEVLAGSKAAPLATCKANEVEIPDTVGRSLAAARARLQGQPLTPEVVYKPARTGERIDLVVDQFPDKGTASAGDKITLVLRKSLHGVIPNVVGMPLARARAKLAKLKLDVATKGASRGKVVAQSVAPHTASAPGEEIVLTVRGTGG